MKERKLIAWNKGNRKYHSLCLTCGTEIGSFYKQKFCNQRCYFSSDQFKKMLSDNGKNNKGKKKKDYRISWGYKYVFLPNHLDSNKQGYLAEHRLVAEKKLGRRILSTEVVHHINEKRDDNRPCNLLVMRKDEHHVLHRYYNKLKKCI